MDHNNSIFGHSSRGRPCLKQLEALVQSICWTYSIYWQLKPENGVLVWEDGFYNGDIKTRKTVQPIEMSGEELCLQRTMQLRQLYESLVSRDDTNQPPRRPCAALSPEDLSDTEWYYLVCMDYSFPPGTGLPGRALASRSLVWLERALESDSSIFSRFLLAKSASIQTVVCFPLGNGVLEIGTTELVGENPGIIHRALSIFIDTPKPAYSEPMAVILPQKHEGEGDDNDEEEDMATALQSSYFSDAPDKILADYAEETAHVKRGCNDNNKNYSSNCNQPCEDEYSAALLSVCFHEQRNERPDDDWPEDFADKHETPMDHYEYHNIPSFSQSQPRINNNCSSLIGPSQHVNDILVSATNEDSPYSRLLSALLKSEQQEIDTSRLHIISQGAFSRWKKKSDGFHYQKSPQRLLKKALFEISRLQDDRQSNTVQTKVLCLQSLLPHSSKGNSKASILDETIHYLRHLKRRTEELEASNKLLEAQLNDRKRRRIHLLDDTNPPLLNTDKIMQVSVRGHQEEDELSNDTNGGIEIQVQCLWRQSILMDIMQTLTALHLQITSVQSSLHSDNIFMAHLRAKVKKGTEDNHVRNSIAAVKAAVTEAVDHRFH